MSTDEDSKMSDLPTEVDEAAAAENKVINEEYKIWKKNAPMLYDLMYSRALDWPTLSTQWFPDVQTDPDTGITTHRLLLGTHTSDQAQNYLQIGGFTMPTNTELDPSEYDEERQEIGGYGATKNTRQDCTFNIVQKIDHDGEVNKARYMPQNPNIIATMSPSAKTCIFDRTKLPSQPTGNVSPQIELVGHSEEGYGLHWNTLKEGELATGAEDKSVRIWNIQEYSKASKALKAERVLTYHTACVNDVEFHPVIPWLLATVSDDLTLQMVDLRENSNTKAAKTVSQAHLDAINSVSFNPGSEYILATGSADKTIGIWDLRVLSTKVHLCESHKDVVGQVEWHPSQKNILASSSYDRRVNFWDLSKVGEEQTPEDAEDGPPELFYMHGGHTNRISDFTFNKNDPWLMCSAAEDNLVQIWKPAASVLGTNETDININELDG